MNHGKTKSGAAIIVAAATLGWLGYTALSLGNRPERIAPSRVPRGQGAEAGGERRMQHTLAAGAASAPAVPGTPRDWAATGSAAAAEATLASLSNKLAQEGAVPTGSSAKADKLGQNIRTIFTPLITGQSDQFRATLGSLGAAPPTDPPPGGPAGGPKGGNPMFKALNGAQLDLAHARVRKLSPEEAKQGPMGGRRRGPGGAGPGGAPGGGGDDGGEDFGAVVAAGFRGAFPEAEKNVEAGTAQVVEVTVPLLINGVTDPDPNAKISFKMVYDKAADAWQPMMLALALKDPAILKQFAPQGG